MSYLTSTLYTILAITTLSILKSILSALRSPLRPIPGPLLNTLTFTPLRTTIITQDRLHYVHALHRRYGPIVRTSPCSVDTSSISAVRQIHKMGSAFTKGDMYDEFELRGTLVCLRGEREHRERRKYFAGALGERKLAEWDEVVFGIVDGVVEGIRSKGGDERGEIDILALFTAMATEIIAEICFGDVFRREGADGRKGELVSGIKRSLRSGKQLQVPIPAKVLQSVPEDGLNVPIPSLSKFTPKGGLGTTVDGDEGGENTRETLLTKALADSEAGILSAEIIAMEGKAFMVAGTDTTAVTLTYLIWATLSHPTVKAKLQTELETIAADPESISQGVHRLTYLNMIVKETLRLYGAVASGLPRMVPKGGREICGYFVPEGTTVTTQSWSVHRNPEVFEDPETFIPERWENPAADMKESFIPFGIGSRACIGLHLAQKELLFGAALFFLKCPTAELAPSMTEKDMEITDHFVNHPRAEKCMITLKN